MTAASEQGYVRPALDDAPFLIGIEDRGAVVHAVLRCEAATASAVTSSESAMTLVAGVCDRWCRLGFGLGAFDSSNEWLSGRDRCPDCAWIVALHSGRIDEQLCALTPRERDRDSLACAIDEPLAAVKIAEAILAAAGYPRTARLFDDDVRPSAVSAQLGHLTRHAPVLLIPEECAERSCEHPAIDDSRGDWRDCTLPDIHVACTACSLVAVDGYARQWAGTVHYECTVAAPCAVLKALGEHYGVTVGDRRERGPLKAPTPIVNAQLQDVDE
jgi:hypothetical protein